ncbi:ABC transporter ATP-binding protein [Roseburia hominis]
MKTENTVIEIRNLTKFYGKHRGVQNVSMKVEKGDIFGFLGPNGAGKSTTIRSMLGLLRFQKGEIRLLGKDAVKENKEILREVGYMPSEAMFYPNMKVKEVIRFAAQARGLHCEKEADRICEMLEVDREKKVRELSLGNRKKVSIVCAMQHKPRLLVLDEPTSGLDPLMQEVFFKLILEYNRQGTTCFLSSHVLSEVKRYCRNAAIIREGVVIRQDTVENLTRTNVRKVKVRHDGKEERFVYTGEMGELLQRLGKMNVEDLLIEEPSLDEVFMHYYDSKEEEGGVMSAEKGGEHGNI